MSEAYERERQNTTSLTALSSKVTALRDVTLDIYTHTQADHGVLDNTSETFSSLGGGLRGSAKRLGVMAKRGDKVAVLKVAGMVVGGGVVVWWVGRWVF